MSEEAVRPRQMTNTHILVQEFAYLEPTSLQEAVSLLSAYGDRADVLAGGTYLLVQMKMERRAPECLVNIQRISELEGVAWQDGALHIGARTSIRMIRDATQIQTDYAALAEACAAFGSTQIQMMGTIGGNLCNGSPASDTVPALMALDAQLLLVGPEGERVVPIEEFLVGPGETALREGELLVSVVLPTPHQCREGSTGSAFVKVSRVAADLAKVSVAAVLVREGDHVADCRLAFGSVGPTVLRARKAEETLVGQAFSPELALEAGRVASEEVSAVDDVRSTAWYRQEVVKAVAHDVLCLAWERAAEQRSIGAKGQESEGASESSRPRGAASTLRVGPEEKHPIELTVNGVRHRLSVAPNELLLNVLRDQLELTGSKYGCGIGECGACTVHLNGKPVLSCLVLAIAADGGEVLTVEGLEGSDGQLDSLQEAFIRHAAFQCGYCTPGMLMMTKSLLRENPTATQDEIRDYLKGNRCRCTGFVSIVRAVMSCVGDQGSTNVGGSGAAGL
jgi:xanthine dehydrogenase iron-sulfur cluster and FAD-binding subunit A